MLTNQQVDAALKRHNVTGRPRVRAGTGNRTKWVPADGPPVKQAPDQDDADRLAEQQARRVERRARKSKARAET